MSQIVVGDCKIDDYQNALIMPDNSCEVLSAPEFRMLMQMIKSEGEAISKRELEAIGWEGRNTSDSSVTVAITNIRKKIKKSESLSIITIPRVGYKLKIEQLKEYDLIVPSTEDSLDPALSADNKPKRKLSRNHIAMFILVLLFSIVAINRYLYRFEEVTCIKNESTICYTHDSPSSPLNQNDNVKGNSIVIVTKEDTNVLQQD
ncbi:transcriptional regulator [Vibrio chagasii]|uniref:winged helix-turn-helix domain-containing protein n=1 Tax=Vibrio chagasii TaxID=170679 RepID=UPI0037358DFE